MATQEEKCEANMSGKVVSLYTQVCLSVSGLQLEINSPSVLLFWPGLPIALNLWLTSLQTLEKKSSILR